VETQFFRRRPELPWKRDHLRPRISRHRPKRALARGKAARSPQGAKVSDPHEPDPHKPCARLSSIHVFC
jgi:hypothetical protein